VEVLEVDAHKVNMQLLYKYLKELVTHGSKARDSMMQLAPTYKERNKGYLTTF